VGPERAVPVREADRAESARVRPALARAHAGGEGRAGRRAGSEVLTSSSHRPGDQLRGARGSGLKYICYCISYHFSSLQLSI
jgi:hypothetical protein